MSKHAPPVRTLVFGPMPAGAAPESHIAAGPWCFAGQESAFPGWDDGGGGSAFNLPPDPFANAKALTRAARSANGEALALTRILGERFNAGKGRDLSERFWLMALGPFLLLAAHMFIERQKRVLDLVELYGGTPLRVEVLPPDMPFAFASSLDFMVHGVQDVHFNHFVYSRIVEAIAPPGWELVRLSALPLHQAQRKPQSPAAGIKECARRLLRDLPFPRFKGFTLGQSLLLSAAVLLNKRQRPDTGLDFALYCDEPPEWRFPARPLIEACLPEAIRDAVLPDLSAGTPGTTPGPLRGMSPVFSQDEAYRLRLAALRERGCRLFCVQHGANYGNLQSVGILPFEYSQHVFFSWGWEEHGGVSANARPMPHPSLTAVAGKHRERAARLILVGAEMSSFSYRLKSRPQAGALPAYRAGKVAFLRTAIEGLGREADILYRPYFKVAGGLDDGEYIRRMMPDTALCQGDLTEQMLGCRLLVLDHYGTTLHMALAADVPLLAFWNRDDWSMDAESDRALDALRDAGILYQQPEQAAAQAVRIWQNVAAWWGGEAVRRARGLWLSRYAKIGDTAEQPLSKTELTKRWFTTLRNC